MISLSSLPLFNSRQNTTSGRISLDRLHYSNKNWKLIFVVETKKEAEASFNVFYKNPLIRMSTPEFELADGKYNRMRSLVNTHFQQKISDSVVDGTFFIFSHYSNPNGILNLNFMETKNVWNTITF